jgi:hypothetical protein
MQCPRCGATHIRSFGSNGEYQGTKAYLQMLDYLRLLTLEYLSLSAMSSRV